MKFEKEKQKAIITYILEKISSGEKDRLTEKIAETLGLNRNTVHSYINKLVDEGIIRRVKRGIYETYISFQGKRESFLPIWEHTENVLNLIQRICLPM